MTDAELREIEERARAALRSDDEVSLATIGVLESVPRLLTALREAREACRLAVTTTGKCPVCLRVATDPDDEHTPDCALARVLGQSLTDEQWRALLARR